MNEDARWLRIKQLFKQSQEKPVAERDAWLVSQCGSDEGLVREVRTLLAAQYGSHNILDRSAVGALNQLSAQARQTLVELRSLTNIKKYLKSARAELVSYKLQIKVHST